MFKVGDKVHLPYEKNIALEFGVISAIKGIGKYEIVFGKGKHATRKVFFTFELLPDMRDF